MHIIHNIVRKILSYPHKTDVGIITLLILLTLLLWWPTQFLPFHWDAAGYIANEAVALADRGFWPLDTRYSDFAHPPALPLLLAGAWHFFGTSKLVSHAVILPFLPILLIGAYFLGKKIASRFVGVAAAFLVLMTPVVIAEYGNIYPDLPVAALTVLALALWLYHRHVSAMIVFSLAVLFKATAIIYLPAFLIFIPVKTLISKPRFLGWLALPLVVLVIWFSHHYSVTGWWLVQPNRPTLIPQTPNQLFNSLWFIFNQVAIFQNRWLILGPTIVATLLLFLKRSPGVFSPKIKSLALIIGISVVAYAVIGEFAMRYGIPIITLFYILCLSVISIAVRKYRLTFQWTLPAIAIASAFSFYLAWHPVLPSTENYTFRPPEDLGYLDMIQIHRQLGASTTLYPDDAQWFGAFPENIYLTQPYLGYVSKAVDFNLCSRFVLNPDKDQYLILHAYSPEQIVCQNVLSRVSVEPVRRIESRDKWLEIYQVGEPLNQDDQTD
jgi:4-amino-4-deoxy-L-arabinose transferase-like glycosyltransferase